MSMPVIQESERRGALLYVICAAPETGAGLLERGLREAGLVGKLAGHADSGDANSSLMIAMPAADNGVYGITPSWHSANAAQAESIKTWTRFIASRLAQKFDQVRYVWLKRRNQIAQSIDRYRVSLEQSARKHMPTEKDFVQIDQLLQVCLEEERAWEQYFRANDLRPLILVYEELIRSYHQTIHGVLVFIGQTPVATMPSRDLAADAVQDQSSAIAWEQRYRTSRAKQATASLVMKSPAPVARPPASALSYLICTEQRTGSTLLADALAGTGIAGTPDEYFTATHNDQYQLMRFGASKESEYLDRLIEKTSSSNGMFGVKVHWNQTTAMRTKLAAALRDEMEDIDSAPLELLVRTKLQSPRYIWLRRKNKVAQAISFYRASRTGVWRSVKGRKDQGNVPDLALPFNADAIDYYVKQCQKMDFEWNHYFRSNRLTALMIFYEDLIVNYELVVRGVLYFLGLPTDTVIPPPGLDRQADERSLEWERRYREMRVGK